MIEVAEPPDVAACGECMNPLVWLYSFRTARAFAVIAVDHETFRIHRCKNLQDAPTWRQLTFRAPGVQVDINRRGRARVNALLQDQPNVETT